MKAYTAIQRSIFLAPLLIAALVTGCGGGGGGSSASSGARKTVIANIGSDTMINLAIAWAEAYSKIEPAVSVEVNGGGSGQGIAALINGSCQIANSSRVLEEKEAAEIKAKRGVEPRESMVGYDALSVYVHKSNPLNEISIEQLAEIYRADGKITKWSQLGVKDIPGAKGDDIIRVSRDRKSTRLNSSH